MKLQELWKIRITRNLAARWIIIIGAIIFPINVFTLVISGYVATIYQERITESYENQLAIYADTLKTEFSQMREQVEIFLDEENRASLILQGPDPAVDMVRLNTQLTAMRNRSSLPGMGYLWSEPQQYASVFRQGTGVSTMQESEVKQYLENMERAGGLTAENEFFSTNTITMLAAHYHFPRFSFGFLYDAKSILQRYYDAIHEPEVMVFLVDENSNILAQYSSLGFEIPTQSQPLETYSAKEYLVLLEGIGFGGISIAGVAKNSVLLAALPTMIWAMRVLTVVALLAIPLLYFAFRRLVIRPLWYLTLGMKEVEEGNLEYRLSEKTSTVQMEYLYHRFNHMVNEIHLLITESYEKEIERLQTDAVNIRLQVNQHMLLNFLNTVYYLNQAGKQQQVGEFVLLLMNHFRYVLRRDAGLVKLKEEIAFVRDYLRLQQIRFPDSFVGVFRIALEAEEVALPQLLVENFVENTIKHALVMSHEISISVEAKVRDGRLLLSICDTGRGIPPEVLEKLEKGEIYEDKIGKHIGVWNCRKRLQLYYGSDYELKVESGLGSGTQVLISLPVNPVSSEDTIRERHILFDSDPEDDLAGMGV